ncbi:MAG: hypothetical protein ABEJ30_08725 [Halorientalis sp.]
MSQESVGSPLEWTVDVVENTWRTFKSVYYADSWSWRFLKSGALVFMGFFLWTSSNLVLSYQPAWGWLTYPMAYGFLLLPYGPFHHVAVIPLSLRLRRRGSRVGRYLPNASLGVFLALVVVLGTFPPGAMTFDFDSALEDTTGTDINPDLLCTRSAHEGTTHIHCHVTTSEGIDHVEVMSGGETVTVDRDPPFEFTVSEGELTSVAGQRQFQVVLRDENGEMIRRYTRTLRMIPSGE